MPRRWRECAVNEVYGPRRTQALANHPPMPRTCQCVTDCAHRPCGAWSSSSIGCCVVIDHRHPRPIDGVQKVTVVPHVHVLHVCCCCYHSATQLGRILNRKPKFKTIQNTTREREKQSEGDYERSISSYNAIVEKLKPPLRVCVVWLFFITGCGKRFFGVVVIGWTLSHRAFSDTAPHQAFTVWTLKPELNTNSPNPTYRCLTLPLWHVNPVESKRGEN